MKFNKEFTKEDLEKVKTMAAIGLPQEKIATVMGISKVTLERMMKHRVAVRDAVQMGKAMASTAVLQTAYSLATSGEHPHFTAFWLKCKEGWRETQHIQLSGPGGGPVSIEDMSVQERNDRIELLLDLRKRLIKDVTPTKTIDIVSSNDSEETE